MKTTKLISMLILLAIISFSCGEDDNKITTENNIAQKYSFQENSKYYYTYIGTDFKNAKDNIEMDFILNITNYEKFNEKNALKVINEKGEYFYFSYENNKIFKTADLMYIFKIQHNNRYLNLFSSSEYWFTDFDFTKDTFNIAINDTLYYSNETDYLIFKQKVFINKEVIYSFDNIDYKGYEIIHELNQHSYEHDYDDEYKENILNGKKTIWYIEGLGIVSFKFESNTEQIPINHDVFRRSFGFTLELTKIEK